LGGSLISAFVNPDLGVVTFAVQPADASVPAGGRARFEVKAKTASTPVYYQWQVNGTDIPGATRPVFITPTLTTSDSGKTYQVIVTVAGFSTPSRKAALTVTPGQPSGLQPYIGVNYIGAGYVSDDAVSLSLADVAGVVLQENWNNAGNGSDPIPLLDASGASTPVTLTASTPSAAALAFWSSGTRSLGNADGDLMQGFLENGTATDPVNLTLANVPAGKYDVIVYTTGFDFQANYQEAFSITGAGTYPTYHGQGETGLDYTQNPAYRRISSTDAASRQKGNYVEFDNVSPAADGSLTITVLWESTTGGSYNPAINGFQLVKVLAVASSPALSVAQSAGSLTISWDQSAAGFVLETSADLGTKASWSSVSGAPNPITGAGSTTVPTNAGAGRFYRLAKH
jgi:hypothetical protein